MKCSLPWLGLSPTSSSWTSACPGRDGYALAQELQLRSEYARLRLIAPTGYGQGRDREASRSRGFDEHIVKPADPQRLIEVVTGRVAAER